MKVRGCSWSSASGDSERAGFTFSRTGLGAGGGVVATDSASVNADCDNGTVASTSASIPMERWRLRSSRAELRFSGDLEGTLLLSGQRYTGDRIRTSEHPHSHTRVNMGQRGTDPAIWFLAS